MTSDQVERAIETLLTNQATFESQLAQTNQNVALVGEQVSELSRQMSMFADTQSDFMGVVLKHIEVQGEINASMRSAVQDLTSIVKSLNGGGSK
jgi:hypothetical protein